MTKSIKKPVSVILALLIMISAFALVPVSVGALTSDEWTYSLSNGNATITSWSAPSGFDGNLVIPSSIDNHPVTAIADEAFYGKSTLTSVTFPASVSSIGTYAFADCLNLANLIVDTNNPYFTSDNGVIYSNNNTKLVLYAPGKTASSFTVPDSVTVIGSGAFYACQNLTSVTIPEGVTAIDSLAFCGCSALTSIEIPDSVTTIGQNAFISSGLQTVTIGSGVTTIGNGAFMSCSRLTNIELPDSLTSIGEQAFASSGLQSVTIGSGIASIEDYAFSNCRSLSSVTILSATVSFNGSYNGWYIFNNCASGLTIIAPDPSTAKTYVQNRGGGVTFKKLTYSENGFEYDTNGSGEAIIMGYTGSGGNVTIPSTIGGNTVTAIDQGAFEGNTTITSVTIPESVTVIYPGAFKDCTNLTAATFLSGSTTFVSYYESVGQFSGCTNLTIYGEAGSSAQSYARSYSIPFVMLGAVVSGDWIYKLQDNAATIQGYNGSDSVVNIPSSLDGNTVTVIGNNVFSGFSAITSVTIPEGVTRIGNGAFSGCSGLTNIELPDSLTSIGEQAFYYCRNLSSIAIPDSVTAIGNSAFASSGLTSIDLPDNLTSIGSDAFSDCSALRSIDMPDNLTSIGNYAFSYCGNLTNITIPESVTTIGERAFGNSGLTEVTIPDSVESIGNYAFYGCYYLSSIELGNGVKNIGNGAFYYSTYYSENPVSIVIPASVETIGGYAFYYVEKLSNAVFLTNDVVIGDEAFKYCADDLTFYGYIPSTAKTYADSNSIQFVDYAAFAYDYTLDGEEQATITKYNGFLTVFELPSELDGHIVTGIAADAFKDNTSIKRLTIPDTVETIENDAFSGCTNLTIWGFDSSAAQAYAESNNIPFVPVVKIRTKTDSQWNSSSYTIAPVVGTQSKDSGDNSFGLSQSKYDNFELLGVQEKTGSDTNDMRFVAVINEGLVRSATNPNDSSGVQDYGFIVAKTDYTSNSAATENYISKVVYGAPNTIVRSCKYTNNRFSGDYGRYASYTKYKYVTLALKNLPENQGYVVRFYVKTKSGKVYYANYNTSYTGCVTSYRRIKTIEEGENSVAFNDEWSSLPDSPFD